MCAKLSKNVEVRNDDRFVRLFKEINGKLLKKSKYLQLNWFTGLIHRKKIHITLIL